MKLADHVDLIRELIESAFDKQFARLGFGKAKQLDADKLPEDVRVKRGRFIGMLDNHIAETGNYELAREKLLDELTFTLFNRFSAIKVMEAANLFPPILTKQIEHGDRSFGHKAWLEINPHMRDEELEGIRNYLKATFDELGKSLHLYSQSYPYAMLPDTVSLNDIIDAFNAVEKDDQVGEDIWHSDDVLGWMYESYNNRKKQVHKNSKDNAGRKIKTEYDKVSLQSQIYTPRWVVRFLVENSVGKMYLEMYPDSEIKQRYKIANAPTEQTRTPKPLHEVRTIDPACGSGNFLLYAFDFYYELYLDQIENYDAEYEEKDIAKLIIENNLHGIDLDDRAVQLAQLGLYIKAKKKRRNIGELNFRVVSSDFYLPDYDEVRHIFEQGSGVERNQKELIEKIWGDLQYAYKFGSLIQVDEQLKKQLSSIKERASDDLFAQADLSEHEGFSERFFSSIKYAIKQYASKGRNTFLSSKTRDAVTFLELISIKYDIASANPPYTDSSDFGPEIKEFIETNYNSPYKFNTNLYATFIKRCYELTLDNGLIAMIHPDTFMFIKTFVDVRSFILEKMHIEILVHFGTGGVFGSSLRVIYPVLYVLNKKNSEDLSSFIDLRSLPMDANIEREELNRKLADSDFIKLNQNDFHVIPSKPFIYWISESFRKSFLNESVKDVLKNCQGLATGNNNQFLRFWWEISSTSDEIDFEKWKYYAKGGPSNKWSGNLWSLVNWENNGYKIKGYSDEKGKQRSRPQNEKLYFKEGVTYSASGGRPSYRYLPKGCIFDVGGSSIFPIKEYKNIKYVLAFFNSTLSKYIIECLNPTLNKQVGDIERIPFVTPSDIYDNKISDLSKENIEITDKINRINLFESSFNQSYFLDYIDSDLEFSIKKYLNFEAFLEVKLIINEYLIDKYIYEVYDLTKQDREMILEKEGDHIGGLPVYKKSLEAYIEYSNTIDEFHSESLFFYSKEIEVSDFDYELKDELYKKLDLLYQGNSSLEDFCTKNKVNPINLWHIFYESNKPPLHRSRLIVTDFIINLVRNILIEDEDGIIPLVLNSGEENLLKRLEKKLFSEGYSSSQISNIEKILNCSIEFFISKKLFESLANRLNVYTYQAKTPFIWHLTSGPEQGFDCYIIIYKWSRDNLQRLRSIYIENRERALINRQSDLSDCESADDQTEKERIFKQLKEIESFKKKIDELLAEGYDPVLDDGVGKNIAPLQQKKMLAYDVLNAGQLKKYLNADW